LDPTYFLPYRHRLLIWQFARREVLARYRGSVAGLAWSFLTPLLMLVVYVFVFRTVFRARWSQSDVDDFTFGLQVYAGLIVFNLFAEVVARAPSLLTAQPNLVKKTVFPLQVLPWVLVLAACFHMAVNFVVLAGATLVARGALPATAVALPLVIAVFVPMLLGLALLLASLGVFLRDIGQFIGSLVSLLMFLSPVFYPASALPEAARPWLALNPLTAIIEQARRVALDGLWPQWDVLAAYLLVASAVAWLGARWFAATRKGFADVL
jgi:lipopolysaccharide transport system permease protein